MSTHPFDSVYTKDNPFHALVLENRVLNLPGSAKETRHFVVGIAGSGIQYKAGDSLGIFASNRASEVDELLGLLGATGEERVVPEKAPEPSSLREALTSRLALSAPTRRIVETLAARATDPAERAKLNGLLGEESKSVLEAFLRERAFVDLLAEFPSARPAPQEFVDHLRRLMPRLYSIASSPKVSPAEVHLTVAIVRYVTNGRSRVGVCSSFLADRVTVGSTPTPVFVSPSHFGPPADGATDAIMVGPGTGIAPFRAFVQDRAASGATGRNWLFYGDQRRSTDFLYGDEWTQHLSRGQLTRLDTAFSRDQLHKIYVQDRMRENAAELWSWIKAGANFYVCGDAKRMARDVDTALHEIVAEQGSMTRQEAVAYVKDMKRGKRYQRDVY